MIDNASNSPPVRTLSKKQLTAALIVVTLLPFSLVVLLYSTLPDIKDPVLKAVVRIGPMAWPNDTAKDARVVPCVIVTNPTKDAWRNVNLSINHQFHFAKNDKDEVRAGEEFFIPLKFFHTKGNQYYPPENQRLKELTIYAQIPSGARAIIEIDGKELPGAQYLLRE